MNLIFIFACLLSLAVLGSVGANSESGTSLKKLCRDDKRAPEITRISQVISIIDALRRSGNAECPAAVQIAFESLEPLIYSEDVCSKETTDAIVDYWARFIDGPEKKNVPLHLKRFFIGFGLQASKVCKEALVSQLSRVEAEKRITREDFNAVTKEIKESGQVRALFGDHIELESLMFLAFDDKKNQEPEVLSLEPKQKRYFDYMRERCSNMFKPIYDTLILPPARLASIGFDYKGPSFVGDLWSFTDTLQFHTWVNVIFACEPAVRFQTTIAPVVKQDADGNKAMVTVLDDDDIAELERSMGVNLQEGPVANTEQVEYKTWARLDDQIIVYEDAYLSSSISGYGHRLKELAKSRAKLVKSFVSLLKFAKKNKLFRVGLRTNSMTKTKHSKFGSSFLGRLSRNMFFRLLVVAATVTFFILAATTPIGAPMWIAFGILMSFIILTVIFHDLPRMIGL